MNTVKPAGLMDRYLCGPGSCAFQESVWGFCSYFVWSICRSQPAVSTRSFPANHDARARRSRWIVIDRWISWFWTGLGGNFTLQISKRFFDEPRSRKKCYVLLLDSYLVVLERHVFGICLFNLLDLYFVSHRSLSKLCNLVPIQHRLPKNPKYCHGTNFYGYDVSDCFVVQ